MRGVANYHRISIIFCFFVVLVPFPQPSSISASTLSSTDSLTISSNRTIVSPGDDFELGFFKPSSSSRWYLGIWHKKVPDTTYVWVANRDNPLSSSTGTLKISDTNLVLLDHSDTIVWSTNRTGESRSPLVAELLDNGNFVLRDSTNNNDPAAFLWQSFDFPTDTVLPQMKLGWDIKRGLNRSLKSWRSPDDPSSGDFEYKLERRGLPEFFLWKMIVRVHRSGPWDGIRFNGVPEVLQQNYMIFNFTENREEIAYTFLMTNQSIYSILTLSSSGSLQRYTWFPTTWRWNLLWSSPTDDCDMYQRCGPYACCDTNTSPVCNCIKGFVPRNPQDWALRDASSGCVRRTELSCGRDGFLRLEKMKLPDTTAAIVNQKIGEKNCEEKCLRDCNCTAFAIMDIRNGDSGCVIWTGELTDIRYSYAVDGQDLYVKLAASDLDRKRDLNRKIIGLIIGVSFTLLLSFIIFIFWKRKQKRGRNRRRERERPSSTYNVTISHDDRSEALLISDSSSSSNNTSTPTTTPTPTSTTKSSKDDVLDIHDFELPLIDFPTIAKATNYFSDSNKLGQGGFGIVYKGRLPYGQDVAVKRLSVTSKQGVTEFKNEVKLIARLQHINLVRLLACCIDQDEKILIYEYLENRSLDSFVFDEALSYKLDWETRYEIINGIARGLLYLHQDSRFRIIHRDFKTSNILLDKNMTPKISDFGMARIFEWNQTEANTVRIVGTYGYMSPEYAMGGLYSTKSDVYSFGVTLLEIICGRKNKRTSSSDELNLVGSVYYNWKQGNELEVVDPLLLDSVLSFQKIQRCLQIGLLCVQEYAHDRPAMSSVVMMLASEMAVSKPNHPGFFVGRNPYEETDPTRSSIPFLTEEFSTVNQVTVSTVQPR